MDHEAEVALVIGHRAWRVSEEEAPRYVFGITCMNDVTARALQDKDVGYTRAKGFDTFAPLGRASRKGSIAPVISRWRVGSTESSGNHRPRAS